MSDARKPELLHCPFCNFNLGIQLMLHSSPMLHHPPLDDDRSAATFWLPRSQDRREQMAIAFEEIARLFRALPPETGLD